MKLYRIQSIRTNNFKDPEMLDKIQHVWQEAYQQQNNASTLYGVYYDYESNYKGDYSLSTAVADNEISSEILDIPEDAPYRIFQIDGTDKQKVLQQWKQIWQLEESGELIRAYTVDYEKYEPDGTVSIHIAVAPDHNSEAAEQ
ncbi:GyrI-like domain-containing protein [Paenibacillus kandeliae]|uniref:GyrI-like domain-containing protein n=1 Tax=Paenibacillus kandeliae TaxID=3231269 RepID=UPI0034587B2D